MRNRVVAKPIASPALCATLLMAAVLLGCAEPRPTGYEARSAGSAYGYRGEQIGDGEYSIVVAGNQFTSADRAASIALLRASRLTLEKGYRRFSVLKREGRQLSGADVILLPLLIGVPTLPVPIGVHVVKRIAVLVIKMVPEHAVDVAGALDAKAVERELAPQIE